jgi:signal transduction histidine kinase
MTETKTTPELKVGAHVLVQLGSELVTDVEQAILECVKNAYDADSPGCKIEIDTREKATIEETSLFSQIGRFIEPAENVLVELVDNHPDASGPDPDETTADDDEDGKTTGDVGGQDRLVTRKLTYVGRVTIEDTGDGLTEDQLRSSWLVISGSKKRAANGPKAKTRRGRTPLGDKGLGRLGTMRLGDILLIESATSPERDIVSAQFRWADCEVADTVNQIPVTIASRENASRFKGTRVSVLGLSDLPEWRRSRRVEEIARSLARLVSPFEATTTFPVGLKLDSVESSLVSITDDVLARAIAEFKFEWSTDKTSGNRVLTATARLRRRLLSSEKNGKQADRTKAVFGNDNGKGFGEDLPKFSRMRGYDEVAVTLQGPWFVTVKRQYDWSELLPDSGISVTDPGPFEGSFYYFHLNDIETSESAASGLAVDKSLIKSMAGISILRDGFRVRSPGDWLGLSSEMTSGSTYGLRVDNTLGYFSLSGDDNYLLTEKSDREGFIEDATYRGFLQIARQCRRFASEAMENVRRSLDDYAKRLPASAPGAAANPIDDVESSLKAASDIREFAEQTASTLQADLAGFEAEISRAEPSDATAAQALRFATNAMTAIEMVRDKLAPAALNAGALSRLRGDIDDRGDQLISLFESAAVGLSARGLAHELRTHLTEIRQRTSAIQQLSKNQGNEASVLPLVRAIRGSCSAIANAASLIDPMLPRSRAVREVISLSDFLDDYFTNRKLSLEKDGVSVRLLAGHPTFEIKANRPRLLQVVDNLVRNSVYWLKRGADPASAAEKLIFVELTPTGFVLWDSGIGVSPKVEDSLFEIFVTTKPNPDAGQGLGLFIITELLSLDGCTVALSHERNEAGRRFKFVVDLSPIIVEA